MTVKTLLSKIPFLGSIFGFFTTNARLAFGYLLIGGMVAALAMATSLWFRAAQLETRNDELRERVTTVETVNKIQDGTIDNLRTLRAQDGIVIDGLVSDFSKLSTVDKATRQKITKLEKQNVEVRSYLDQPLPADLVCLFDGTLCAGDGSAGGAGETATAKPTTSAVQGTRKASTATKP